MNKVSGLEGARAGNVVGWITEVANEGNPLASNYLFSASKKIVLFGKGKIIEYISVVSKLEFDSYADNKPKIFFRPLCSALALRRRVMRASINQELISG